MLEALDRTEAVMDTSPGLRDLVKNLAHRGALPNQDKLKFSADEIEALADGRPDTVRQRATNAESAAALDRDLLGFEAIVRQVGRPTLLVQDGEVVLADRMDGFPADIESHLRRVHDTVGRVGRVELINYRLQWAGTGWIVEQGLAITNRHVAELFAGRRGAKGFGFLLNPTIGIPYGARLDFRQEYDRPALARIQVKAIRYVAGPGEPDIALLELVADSALPDPIPLASTETTKQALIGVVGFPAYDSRNDRNDIAHYFGDIFDKKRFAPGFVTQDTSSSPLLMHDCTTLGGNSGSVMFDLSTGDAVGLHFAGTYLEGNFAVSVQHIKAALAGSRTAVSFAREAAAAELERPDGEHRPEYFAGRTGYSASFLAESDDLGDDAAPEALTVHLPQLSEEALEDAVPVSVDGNDSHIIPYRHFSVVYSKSRRLPRLTAVNIDGTRYRKIKRGNDQWFRDLRLPRELQLGREDYADPEIDRGHMVRREDPNWGDEAEAREGNFDTFHYTNAAPQHAKLNQNKQAWLGLEDYVLGSARTHGLRAVVFTGPLLRDADPILNGTDVQVPQEFWKVVVMVDADRRKLHATGYVLGQGELIRDITEGFLYGQFGTYQVRVADIGAQTGLDFGVLVDSDPLAARAKNEEANGGRLVSLPLESSEDAYLG